jgi:hypothetical protein
MTSLISAFGRDPDLASIDANDRAKLLQLLYIASGCDFLSFWVGHGKCGFLNCLFQYAPFITSGRYAVGKMTDIENFEQSLFAFYRMIGSLYFKQARTEFSSEFTNPSDLFKDLKNKYPNSNDLEIHNLWLSNIRNAVNARTIGGEEHAMPSDSAITKHWQRSVLIHKVWAQAAENKVSVPSFQEYGFAIENKQLKVIWDTNEHMALIEKRTKRLLNGCSCKKGCKHQSCSCRGSCKPCGAGCKCLNCTNVCEETTAQQNEIVISDILSQEQDATIEPDNDLEVEFEEVANIEYEMPQEDTPDNINKDVDIDMDVDIDDNQDN